MSALKVNSASKNFGSIPAVSKLSFTVEAGKAFCLLGGNGAGKSTTMNLLLGFLQPDGGELHFDQWDLWKDRAAARRHIFYLPDQVSLYPEFSAVENLRYLTKLSGLSVGIEAITNALLEVGLPAEAHENRISEYSKGMRQKVGLALARLKDAKLLLLDEPTTGLDPISIKEFIALVGSLKQEGACVVMVSHDLQCAHLLADEIGILQTGVLQARFANESLSLDELEKHYFNSVI